jgi:hypothetical protein
MLLSLLRLPLLRPYSVKPQTLQRLWANLRLPLLLPVPFPWTK